MTLIIFTWRTDRNYKLYVRFLLQINYTNAFYIKVMAAKIYNLILIFKTSHTRRRYNIKIMYSMQAIRHEYIKVLKFWAYPYIGHECSSLTVHSKQFFIKMLVLLNLIFMFHSYLSIYHLGFIFSINNVLLQYGSSWLVWFICNNISKNLYLLPRKKAQTFEEIQQTILNSQYMQAECV
jgi:hypothetical protein